jgi:hypothetical protein
VQRAIEPKPVPAERLQVLGARFGVSGTWRLTEVLRAELTLGPGVALHGVAAKDGLAEVMSTGGVELHGALGIGGLF